MARSAFNRFQDCDKQDEEQLENSEINEASKRLLFYYCQLNLLGVLVVILDYFNIGKHTNN